MNERYQEKTPEQTPQKVDMENTIKQLKVIEEKKSQSNLQLNSNLNMSINTISKTQET